MNTTTPQAQGVGIDPAVDAIRPEILRLLAHIEQEHDLRIVYACESGSRAWGFASGNSDFDIRFIFIRPATAYLRLRPPTDAFDLPADGDLDAGGWDIRKTAELMRRSNPPLLEWLDSPIVYRADGDISDALIRLRSIYFDPKKAAYHYLSMANSVFQSYLDDLEPKRKKYLYALRPLAAIRYIELHNAQPPTVMSQTLAAINWPAQAMAAITKLVEQKKAGEELGCGPRDPVLDEHIQQALAHGETVAAALPINNVSTQQLDELIHQAILPQDVQ